MSERNVEISIFDHLEDNRYKIKNLRDIFLFLRRRDILYVDVSGGGEVISELCYEKLICEMRLNISGQLCGSLNSKGVVRPTLFPSKFHVYLPDNTPLISHKAIRLFDNNFLFLRSEITYRH